MVDRYRSRILSPGPLYSLLGNIPRYYYPQPLGAPLDEDQERLLRNQRSLENLSTQAEVLGLQDTQGRGPRGFLTTSLDYLTRPQSAVLGFLTGLYGAEQPGQTQGALQRAAAALTGRERYTGADVVGRAAENAGILERGLRSALGFGIDVATDPLTYLTLGRGGVIRGAGAAAATEAQVGRTAARVLEPIPTPEVPITRPVEAATAAGTASERALARAQGIRTTDQPVVRLGAGRTTATQAPEIPTPAVPATPATALTPTPFESRLAAGSVEIPRVEPIAQPAAVSPRQELIDRIAKAAGEGQALRGGRGARDAIEKTLIDEGFDAKQAADLTRRIITGTSGEVRGGIGVRIPFLGRDASGNLVPAGEAVTRRAFDLTPGAGYLTDSLGLRSMAEAARDAFNTYRSGAFYQGWSKMMNGKFGQEYADFIRTASTGKGAMNYETFTKIIANDSKRVAALEAIDKSASSVIQTAYKIAENSKDKKRTLDAAERYYQMADDMVLAVDADDVERAGFEIAAALREHGQNMFEELKEASRLAGVDFGDVSTIARNFIPRPITLEEAALRAREGKRVGRYSADKRRRIGYDTDQAGRLDSASNEELNQRFIDQGIREKGHKVFETDPLKIAAQQYASYSELMNKMYLIADLKATGLLRERTADTVRLLNLPQVAARAQKFEDTLTQVSERLTNALNQAIENGDTAQIDRVSKAIEKVATDGMVIRAVLANIQDVRPESLRVIGNLTNVMKSALAAGEEAGVVLTKAQKARLFSARGLVQTRGTGGNIQELLSEGFAPIGLTEGVRIPRGLDNMYVDETVKYVVEKYFKTQTGTFRDSKWFNEVYQPYYTLFKTYATVGRPGGYHLRNLQGAWWNNYLGDVSAADHKLSASVLREINRSQQQAENAITNIRAGKASGLTGDADKLAKSIVDLGRSRGSEVVEFEVAQLADYLVYKNLEKVKVGESTMSEVLEAARNNNIFRTSRRLEYLRNEARAEGVELVDALTDPNTMNLFRGVGSAELTDWQKTLNKAANLGYIRASGNVADISENYVRLAAFISGARRYGVKDNGTAASYLTKALQFDYADLSDVERVYLKNVLPFYTWTRRNVPLQFFALLNQPGKFNKLDFAKEELQAQFGADGDEQPMADLVPEWMREKMGFVTRFSVGAGPITISGPGFEAPAFDLNRFIPSGRGSFEDIRSEIISASNPLAKALVEGLIDVDTFTGGKFPEEGVPSLFGELPIPGLTFLGPEGERRMNAKSVNILTDLVPPLGMAARLASPAYADRRLTNWLSTILGFSGSTLTPGQATAELRSRTDKLALQVERTANALGVDREWLREQIDNGYTADQIRTAIVYGQGRRPRSAE